MGSNPTSPTMSREKKNYVWTPQLAYIVGLITTDGCLSNDGRHISFRSSDYQLIETFKNCLKSPASIVKSNPKYHPLAVKPTYRIQCGDVSLYKWLTNIGLTPAKTKTIAKLKVPSKYFSDFLRGHLDGDGTVKVYDDSYNNYRGRNYLNIRVATYFISASKTHIEWLQQRIAKQISVNGAIFNGKGKNLSMWTLKYSKNESEKLLDWIYYSDDLPCLERKKLLAQKALSVIQSTMRKTYTKI